MKNGEILRYIEGKYMKKPKGEKIDLLYSKPEDKKSKKVKKEKKKKSNKKDKSNKNSNRINLNNEIIIGLTPKKEEKKPKKKADKKTPKGKTTKKKEAKKPTKKKTIKKVISEAEIKKRKMVIKIIRGIFLIILVIVCLILFMLSSIFNIKEITVSGNLQIPSAKIIERSGIKQNNNMFRTSMSQAAAKIKENPYIAEVKITRHWDGIVNIEVTERVPTFMIATPETGTYAYINNQGYILKVSEVILEVPTITGIQTKTEEIKPGGRLIKEDLIKLDTVLKIMETAGNHNISNLITVIDISDNKEFTLYLEEEQKIIYFGDSSKISQKMLWIVSVLEDTIGIEGEIFINNIDKNKDVVFREKV